MQEEGGVTDYSLHNAHLLLDRRGIPDQVEVYQAADAEDTTGHLVKAIWTGRGEHVFSGFSWGYRGTGPHGLARLFELLEFDPAITVEEIATWPQDLVGLAFTKGKEYSHVGPNDETRKLTPPRGVAR
ncbi:MAG: hypothetical protein ACRD1X_14620 [Vicinamibacteria bacterium]